jgi:hypothetical protein
MLSRALFAAAEGVHDHIGSLSSLFSDFLCALITVSGRHLVRIFGCLVSLNVVVRAALPSMIVSHIFVYPRRSSSASSAELGGADEA